MIAIASGKGGTGKTTVAVNLALALSEKYPVTLLDCDVEEPNSGQFLDLVMDPSEEVAVSIPQPIFDENICTHCGKCSHFCRYHAIAVLPDRIMFFPELCNGCGGCTIICPEHAISENTRQVGRIRHGMAGDGGRSGGGPGNKHGTVGLDFFEGRLDPGEAKAVPVISALKKRAPSTGGIILLDSSPGTSCPVLETVRDADFCLLVTEPTPFGLHDLKLAVDAISILEVPMAVVINRHGIGNAETENYCRERGIDVILKIPQDMEIARLYSDGIPFVHTIPELRERLLLMFQIIRERIEPTSIRSGPGESSTTDRGNGQ